MSTYTTPEAIAAKCGVTVQTVRSHLRDRHLLEKCSPRDEENWWRVDVAVAAEIEAELLDGGRIVPGQPRKGWHKIVQFARRKEAIERAGQSVLFA